MRHDDAVLGERAVRQREFARIVDIAAVEVEKRNRFFVARVEVEGKPSYRNSRRRKIAVFADDPRDKQLIAADFGVRFAVLAEHDARRPFRVRERTGEFNDVARQNLAAFGEVERIAEARIIAVRIERYRLFRKRYHEFGEIRPAREGFFDFIRAVGNRLDRQTDRFSAFFHIKASRSRRRRNGDNGVFRHRARFKRIGEHDFARVV